MVHACIPLRGAGCRGSCLSRTCERPPIVHPAARCTRAAAVARRSAPPFCRLDGCASHDTLPGEFATARTRPRADNLLQRDGGMDVTEGGALESTQGRPKLTHPLGKRKRRRTLPGRTLIAMSSCLPDPICIFFSPGSQVAHTWLARVCHANRLMSQFGRERPVAAEGAGVAQISASCPNLHAFLRQRDQIVAWAIFACFEPSLRPMRPARFPAM